MKQVALAAAVSLVITTGAAHAQPVSAEMSPAVTWDPYNEMGTIPAARRLSAGEVKLARERAARMFDAVKVAPSFNRPVDRASLVTSLARMDTATVMNQDFAPYWSSPRDVRRGAGGVLRPVLGGAHNPLSIRTNVAPSGSKLVDRSTRGDFSRDQDGRADAYFAAPRTCGELAGGTIYADMIVFTRDGRSALVPAPIGALLQIEVARLTKVAGEIERNFAGRLKELDASMTPQAVAERRAKRERIWSKETREPAALAKRLDAAHRSDESDYQRQKQYFSTDAPRVPASTLWRPRLALEAAQAKLASLDAAGRQQPACGRMEPGFDSQSGVRYEIAGTLPDCVPMVRVRSDLIDPARPVTEVQLMTVWFGEDLCGESLGGAPLGRSALCRYAVPLLREMDWSAARKAIGW